MATFVLIHGAGDDSWYWHLVSPILAGGRPRRRAPSTCPVTTTRPGWPSTPMSSSRPSVIVDDLVLVAQSLGRPHRAAGVRAGVRRSDGAPRRDGAGRRARRQGICGPNTGLAEARRQQAERDGRSIDGEFDPVEEFLHDLPPGVLAEALARPIRDQSGTPVREAVAARPVARRAHPVPALPRRPVLPGRLPAAGRAGASRDRPRRDGRRPLRGPRPALTISPPGSSRTWPSSPILVSPATGVGDPVATRRGLPGSVAGRRSAAAGRAPGCRPRPRRAPGLVPGTRRGCRSGRLRRRGHRCSRTAAKAWSSSSESSLTR